MSKILCFDGVTGAGKTTQIAKLSKFLEERELKFKAIHEKNYQPFRSVVLDWHYNHYRESFSSDDVRRFAKARSEVFKKEVEPLISAIDYVIFDRYYYTSAVYQAGELTPESIIEINLGEGAVVPNKGLVLICKPETSLYRVEERRKRIGEYKGPSLHETLEEITKRRGLYIQLVKNHPELSIVDCEKDEEEIFKEIKQKLGW